MAEERDDYLDDSETYDEFLCCLGMIGDLALGLVLLGAFGSLVDWW